MKDKSFSYWRDYFQGVNCSIFEIIENAIKVAATDHPNEFKLQRGQIVEKLYYCQAGTQCCGQNHNELAMLNETNNGNFNDEHAIVMANTRLTSNAADLEVGGSEQSKVDSSSDQTEMNTTQESKYSYSEAEALTDEIDEESEIFLEVLRTKEILENSQDESETVLLESLRKLQLMVHSVEVLQNLIAVVYSSGWKIMTNEWLDAAAIIAEGPVDSNPSTVFDEEGLPSPPLDEGALFASKTPIKLSQFFDGIDDDGNFELNMEYDKNLESGTKPLLGNQNSTKHNSQLPMEATIPIRDKKHHLTQQQSVIKLTSNTETSNTISKKGRTHNLNLEQKVNNEIDFQLQASISISSTIFFQKSRLLDDAAVQAKLKATKRKLQASYQQAENAKMQRKTKFVDLHELPKQRLRRKKPYSKC
ncbi:probable mediator of RNA polymerase II transcription subunit 26b [Quercus robur]|uniref:probable mediator of RNA polymerase II transcription subunit 26b n=1 Tax=Quercus robur TaxID=38942 RepID=UPI0021636C42|nr:probable mediator of RNA polymerase II transcription subunit 26b [Quercus robur]